MGVIISAHKRYIVYKKTDFRCSICGSKDRLTVDHFIPSWTRIVSNTEANLIPMCEYHNEEKDCHFITLTQLVYLPEKEKERLMMFYKQNRGYFRKYVREYGSMRTSSILNVNDAMTALDSYDEWLKKHKLFYD